MISDMSNTPNWEAMYKCLNEKYVAIEKENAKLQKIVKEGESYQDKLQDRIDDLCKIVALLTKGYL